MKNRFEMKLPKSICHSFLILLLTLIAFSAISQVSEPGLWFNQKDLLNIKNQIEFGKQKETEAKLYKELSVNLQDQLFNERQKSLNLTNQLQFKDIQLDNRDRLANNLNGQLIEVNQKISTKNKLIAGLFVVVALETLLIIVK